MIASTSDIRSVEVGEPASPMVLAVQTAPRSEPTLVRTLDALGPAGLPRWQGPRIIVADGYHPEVPNRHAGWEIIVSRGTAGSAKTMRTLLRAAFALCPDLSGLLYLQDDVVLATNALDYIRRVRVDDYAFVSWFADHPYVVGSGASILAIPDADWVTTQAASISRASLLEAITSPVLDSWRQHGCDRMLAAATSSRRPIAVHEPSIAQHIGAGLSTIVDAWSPRASPTFIGEDADALSLA